MVIHGLFQVLYETFQRLCCSLVHKASDQDYILWRFTFRNLLLHNRDKFLQALQMGYPLQLTNHFTCYIETPV
jgi:hypothetical protein